MLRFAQWNSSTESELISSLILIFHTWRTKITGFFAMKNHRRVRSAKPSQLPVFAVLCRAFVHADLWWWVCKSLTQSISKGIETYGFIVCYVEINCTVLSSEMFLRAEKLTVSRERRMAAHQISIELIIKFHSLKESFSSRLCADRIIVTFRSEYKYDFSNLVRRVYINTSNTNLVPRASLSTGQPHGGARALRTWTWVVSYSYSDLKVPIYLVWVRSSKCLVMGHPQQSLLLQARLEDTA